MLTHLLKPDQVDIKIFCLFCHNFFSTIYQMSNKLYGCCVKVYIFHPIVKIFHIRLLPIWLVGVDPENPQFDHIRRFLLNPYSPIYEWFYTHFSFGHCFFLQINQNDIPHCGTLAVAASKAMTFVELLSLIYHGGKQFYKRVEFQILPFFLVTITKLSK